MDDLKSVTRRDVGFDARQLNAIGDRLDFASGKQGGNARQDLPHLKTRKNQTGRRAVR